MRYRLFKHPILACLVFSLVAGTVAATVLPTLSYAQVNDELIKQQEDARLYLEMIDILKDAPFQEQISGWEKFIKEHADSYFREEIQANLDNMKARRVIQEKSREEEDSRLYFKTVEQAASLPLDKQITLWDRYLRENPDSLFANEARTTMNRLKEEQRWGGGEIPNTAPMVPPGTPAPMSTPVAPPPAQSVPTIQPVPMSAAPATQNSTVATANPAVDKPYLDPDRALFLAAVPGALIPGLGHFYSKRYGMGGFIVAMRVVGLSLLAMGAYRSNNVLIVPGAVVAGTSYALDVVMAPIEARNYNYTLDPLPDIDDAQVPQANFFLHSADERLADATPSFNIGWTFKF